MGGPWVEVSNKLDKDGTVVKGASPFRPYPCKTCYQERCETLFILWPGVGYERAGFVCCAAFEVTIDRGSARSYCYGGGAGARTGRATNGEAGGGLSGFR